MNGMEANFSVNLEIEGVKEATEKVARLMSLLKEAEEIMGEISEIEFDCKVK